MEQEIKDIKELTNDDLLNLYSSIKEHIKYLNEQIIVPVEETVEEESGDDKNE